MVTIYSTPDCQPCKTAVKILDAKGIPNEKIDLTLDAAKLSELKTRMNSDTLSTPTFEFDGKLYQGMQTLNTVIDKATV